MPFISRKRVCGVSEGVTGDDVDDTAKGAGAIEGGAGPLYDLHSLHFAGGRWRPI